MKSDLPRTAVLFAAHAPTPEQEERFLAFLREKHPSVERLVFQKSPETQTGFRLQVGSEIYDRTARTQGERLSGELIGLAEQKGDILPLIRDTVHHWAPAPDAEEIGTVESVGDGIAIVTGISRAFYGEILLFEDGVRGMVLDLSPERVGCVLFDTAETVTEGTVVRRTGKESGIPVGDAFLGRVINALGQPLDGAGDIVCSGYRPVEHPAPGILDRQPVGEPLYTGILAIDSMLPIGKGQRELIIGDRQTGKTTIALDTILNQKGKDVICIYVSIGQKSGSVAALCDTLRREGALDYTVVVHAGAADAAPLQYIAPYAGCALAEYFMEQGKDVLIVYDDLSKHAAAYRSLSLLLGHIPGREAYPGDVFYLHSRLLERAARLRDDLGGGSITALPIVETQEGDVSAYIPTNIISITDGQIFLEEDLFFAGQRPAINVGLSVSRVGGSAQTKAVRSACGTLRLDLAQYREMQVFTQFSSDLDDMTKQQLVYGQGLMVALRQAPSSPLSHHQQVILLTVMMGHRLEHLPVEDIPAARDEVITYFEQNRGDLCRRIDETGSLSDKDRDEILHAVDALPLFRREG